MPRGAGSRRRRPSYAEGEAMPRGILACPTPPLPEELCRGGPSAETCAEGDKSYAEGFPPSAQLAIPVVIPRIGDQSQKASRNKGLRDR